MLDKLKNIIFMGTPEFGVPCLRLMVEKGYKPILSITQPDRPKGRKKKLHPPAIKIESEKMGIEVAQPEDVNDEQFLDKLEKMKPDIIITVAYGGYLKKRIRKIPKFGCINLHPSLLPLYRGSAPINYTLFNGDKKTGISIFKIVAKMDAGPVIFQKELDITNINNYQNLYKKLSVLGAEYMINVLQNYENNSIELIPQNHKKATFSNKIFKKDMWLDWNNKAEFIQNHIKGLADNPGVTASFRNNRIKIMEVEITKEISEKSSGTVIEIYKNNGILVATKDFNIIVKRVQPAGKKIMDSNAFDLGARIKKNEKFENGF